MWKTDKSEKKNKMFVSSGKGGGENGATGRRTSGPFELGVTKNFSVSKKNWPADTLYKRGGGGGARWWQDPGIMKGEKRRGGELATVMEERNCKRVNGLELGIGGESRRKEGALFRKKVRNGGGGGEEKWAG